MAQFTLITNKNEEIYPNEIDLEERKNLYEKIANEGLRLYCKCNLECEYRIRNNSWAIYPCSQGNQEKHEDWCSKSLRYQINRGYNSGFLMDEDTGEVQVHLSEALSPPREDDGNVADNIEVIHRREGRRYPQDQQGEISISAMIKKMNMLTFKHVAFSKKDEKSYPKASEMINKMYWASSRTRIGKSRKSIAELTIGQNRMKFVYEELKCLPKFDIGTRNTRLPIKKEKDKVPITIPVRTTELLRAIGKFENTYGTKNFDGKNIFLAGFRDKYGIYNLRFLLVNDYGLFSESTYEVEMYNAICEIINGNDFKRQGVHFYKPYEYGFGAYEDKYLEDGIIEFDGTNRKIIIEVYGRNDEEYLERKAIKEKMLSLKNNIYTYIPWNAYNNEPLPYDKIRREIEGLLRDN